MTTSDDTTPGRDQFRDITDEELADEIRRRNRTGWHLYAEGWVQEK